MPTTTITPQMSTALKTRVDGFPQGPHRTLAALKRRGLLDGAGRINDSGLAAIGEPKPKPVRETIRVTIAGPSLRDQSKGNFEVHAAGCADIAKKAKRDLAFADDRTWSMDAASADEVGDEIYADHIAEGSMEPGESTSDCHFAPCCRFPGTGPDTAAETGRASLTNSRRRALIQLADAASEGAAIEVNGRQARQPFEYFVEVGYATVSATGKPVYYATPAGIARAATINRKKYVSWGPDVKVVDSKRRRREPEVGIAGSEADDLRKLL